MATGELIVAPRASEIARPDDVRAADFLPVLTVDESLHRKEQMNLFISKVMRDGEDYGVIPGSKKPTLYKAGAEKLCSLFGLTPQYTADTIIEDWTGEHHGGEPMFYYAYRCSLSRGGRFMGEAIGSCSSWESKYRHRWVREDQLGNQAEHKATFPSRGGKQTLFAYDFAIEKAETTGDYGKPPEYWERFKAAIADGSAKKVTKPYKSGKTGVGYEITVDTTLYRIPNPDVADAVNTIQKMAQKRALVDAVKIVTNASDAFTQDLEDFVEPGHAATVPREEGSGSISSGGELFDNDEPEPQGKPPAPQASQRSQSPQQAQQRAVQAQFLQQQQTKAEDRPIPEELTVMFKAIDEAKGADDRVKAIDNAHRILEGSFRSLNHGDAMDELEQIKRAFRNKFPKGKGKQVDNLDFKICFLDMWDAYKRWQQHLEHINGQHS